MPRGDIRIALAPPTRGLRVDLPAHLVPDGFLTGGENVLCRDGVLLVRPGSLPLTSTAPSANRVMGGLFYEDHTQTERVLIGTRASFHLFSGGSWSDITGSALTGSADAQVRFAVYPKSNSTVVIAVNDTDVPQAYAGSGTFAALAGSPPIAKDVTVAFDRVILANVTVSGTRRSSSLWISGFQDTTAWTSQQEVGLPDDKDSIVAVRALNPQLFAIYKDTSQWVGTGAGGIFPFVFELRDHESGPVSPSVVVQAENAHYYIGQDGDVYRFDGNRCEAIGGMIKRLIQTDLYWVNRGRSHGFYDPINREIWWFWESGGSGNPVHGIAYRLPYADVPGAFSTYMTYNLHYTASFGWRITSNLTWNGLVPPTIPAPGTWDTLPFPTWDSMILRGRPGGLTGDDTGQVYHFGVALGDNGYAYDASWDLPFRPATGDGQNVRVDAIESFFRRTALPTLAEIVLVTSDMLNEPGTAMTPQQIQLSGTDKLRATYYDTQARFVAVRHRLLGTKGSQQYRGGVVYCYRRGEA